ncbi:MAG TPA: NAD-dependent epimerase/dehydratase family protein [Burkholderiales bacterium]|nr:NAD-dependent epimerase/dehydratase family protein [Burkholderiales bacterium]
MAQYSRREIACMSRHILITGGAGFIGSHLADALLRRGCDVRVLDSLVSQVHGEHHPDYLDPNVELFHGDLRDSATVHRALRGVDAVYHFAAAVGVGQSMYEIQTYTSINSVGTAVLLEALTAQPVEKLIVASSMSVYGEGLYLGSDGSARIVVERSLEQLKRCAWEFTGSDGAPLEPVATPETKPPSLSSVYALTKYDQECLCLMVGRAYRIPTIALRFFNVYGPRQALSNPYTGVLAIFASRYLNGKAPLIFEDGNQRRDFVSVHDVVQACLLSLDATEMSERIFNVGSGAGYTVRELAERMARALGKEDIAPQISGKYRVGDIRHCFADISLARAYLGYIPRVGLEDGIVELAAWLDGRTATDRVERASAELAQRGLTL